MQRDLDDIPTPSLEQIEELKQLEAAATKGPWRACDPEDPDEPVTHVYGPAAKHPDDYVVQVRCDGWGKEFDQAEIDAKFIATARNLLPGLLSRIAELETKTVLYHIIDIDGETQAVADALLMWKERAERAEASLGIAPAESEARP